MARLPRVVIPGIPHHVVQRGNRRQPVFFSNSDYRFYLTLLADYCAREAVRLWAYCLMPNHVHLVLVPTNETGLRKAVAEVHRRYTLFVNIREGWTGCLWQGRFSSFPMDEAHLHHAVRYIEMNPVRAGLCRTADEWQWSSARAHLGLRNETIVELEPMRRRVDDWTAYLGKKETPSMVDKFRMHAKTGRPLGSDDFVKKLESIAGRVLTPRKRGPKPAPAVVDSLSDDT